jgi:hypothetical protein
MSYKTGRRHEFLSDLEEYYFILVEWNASIVDIREQYPLLPSDMTLQIAEEFEFVHPRKPATKEDIVMTTDFVLTVNIDGKEHDVARCIKPKAESERPRIREKLAIEREYWRCKGIEWKVITEESIPIVKAKNLKMLRGNFFFRISIEEQQLLNILLYEIYARKQNQYYRTNIAEFCLEIDSNYLLDQGTSLKLFKYLIYEKKIRVDLNERLNFRKLCLEGVEVIND